MLEPPVIESTMLTTAAAAAAAASSLLSTHTLLSAGKQLHLREAELTFWIGRYDLLDLKDE